MLLFSGCASYTAKPLVPTDLIHLLADRSVASSEVLRHAPESYSVEDGLRLQEAESVALFYNQSLRSARLKAQVSVLSATEAGRWDDPELGVDLLRVLKTEPMQKPWILGSSVAFTLPLSGRLSVEKTKASAEARVALVEAWGAEQSLLRELRIAWIEWEAASRSLVTSRDLLDRLEEVVAITERLERAGELLPVEGIAFRLARARWHLDLEELNAEKGQSKLKLCALMGLPPQVELKPILTVSEIDIAPPSHETLIERNPSILEAEAAYEAAEQALLLEIRRQYPDIQLGPAYGNEDGQARLGVGFSIPIPILNANKRAVVEATASREAARAAWEESVLQAISDLSAAQSRMGAAQLRRKTVHETIIPLAESQLAEARRLAEQGEVNALFLLEALSSQRETALSQIEADSRLARASVEVQALVPDESPNNLGESVPDTIFTQK